MRLSTPQPARHPNPTTRASGLAYAIFDRPDLKKAEEYLVDFGLRPVSNDGQLLFMRGTGPAPFVYVVQKAAKPRFVGLGLEVEFAGRSRSAGEASGGVRDRDVGLAGRRTAGAPDRPVRLPRRRHIWPIERSPNSRIGRRCRSIRSTPRRA